MATAGDQMDTVHLVLSYLFLFADAHGLVRVLLPQAAVGAGGVFEVVVVVCKRCVRERIGVCFSRGPAVEHAERVVVVSIPLPAGARERETDGAP